MTTRRSVRAATIAALAALVVGAVAAPGASQAAPPPPPPPSVIAVSGHAVGIFSQLQFDDEVVDTSAVLEAMRAGDSAALEELLTSAGIDISGEGDVTPQVVETLTVGPEPEVTLPPEGGGPFTDSLPSSGFGAPVDAQLTGPLAVSTEGALGPAGYAASTASIEEVNGEEFADLVFSADLVEVECRSDLPGGPTGSTRFVDGIDFFDDPLPELPEPNTVLVDEVLEIPLGAGVLRATLQLVGNEQTVGANDITVVGARAFALIEFLVDGVDPEFVSQTDTVIGETQCGVVPGVVLEPTFTG